MGAGMMPAATAVHPHLAKSSESDPSGAEIGALRCSHSSQNPEKP
jgi:hypothetical protein